MEVASHVQKHTSSRGVTSSRARKATARRVRLCVLLAACKTLAKAASQALRLRVAVSPCAVLLARPNGSKRPREPRGAESHALRGAPADCSGPLLFRLRRAARRTRAPLGRLNKP